MSTATQRNRDFVRKCLLHITNMRADGVRFTFDTVIRDVLAGPAPSYYAEYYRANVILRRALRNGGTVRSRYRSSRMWADMYDDLVELMRRNPGRSFHEIVLDLCTGGVGHPRFYMTRRTAARVLRKHLDSSPLMWR